MMLKQSQYKNLEDDAHISSCMLLNTHSMKVDSILSDEKFMDDANRINSCMQIEASCLASPQMNSYAFYCQSLTTTIQRYGNFDRKQIEELFYEKDVNEEKRAVRKRVIVSCDLANSLKVDQMSDCFRKLNSITVEYRYLRSASQVAVR